MKSEVSGAFSSAIGLLRFRVAHHRVAPDLVGPVGPARQVLYFAAFAAERTPVGVDRLFPAEHTPALIRLDGHEFYSIGAGGSGPRGRTPRVPCITPLPGRGGGRPAPTR